MYCIGPNSQFRDLCNLKVREDVFHFIAICPILKAFRLRFFGANLLDMEQTFEFLNGNHGWEVLYNYSANALRYRQRIIEKDF